MFLAMPRVQGRYPSGQRDRPHALGHRSQGGGAADAVGTDNQVGQMGIPGRATPLPLGPRKVDYLASLGLEEFPLRRINLLGLADIDDDVAIVGRQRVPIGLGGGLGQPRLYCCVELLKIKLVPF